jgi:hypothetical protein
VNPRSTPPRRARSARDRVPNASSAPASFSRHD